MKKRYLITITTLHGTKHFFISQIIKYVLLFLLFIFILIGAGTYLYIHFLHSHLQKEEAQKVKLIEQIKVLNKQSESLQKELEQFSSKLLLKKSELAKLNSKIEDLQTIMGLEGNTFVTKIDKDLSAQDIDRILRLIPSGSPVKGGRITAPFGWRRHPILKKREFHPGLDIAKKGRVPIFATAAGIVTAATFNKYGYGRSVRIAHLYGFSTLYAHLKSIEVKRGAFVKKGDIIGYMGSSGLSTGQHLHYELRFCNTPLNPIKFIQWSGKNFYTIFKQERHVPWQSLVKAIKRAVSPMKRPSSPSSAKSRASSN